MGKKRGAPKKPVGKTKESTKQIRLSDADRETFQGAADLAGIPVSAWMRERLRQIARAELESAGKPVPFLLD